MNIKHSRSMCWLAVALLAGLGTLFAQQFNSSRMETKKTGLPYVQVLLDNQTSVKMSPKASNVYIKDKSKLAGFVLVDGIYYLPSEKEAPADTLTGKIHQQVKKAATLAELENTYCAETDFACRDFVYISYLTLKSSGESIDLLPSLVNGAKDDFAQALRREKRKKINLTMSEEMINKPVEQRQYKRLIGDNYDIAALRSFLEQGEFTYAGWLLALDNLCEAGRAHKLSKQQLKEVNQLAKRVEKGFARGDLPAVRVSADDNRDFEAAKGKVSSSLKCISIYCGA